MSDTNPTSAPATDDPGHLQPLPETEPNTQPVEQPVTPATNVFAVISFVLAITGAALPGIIFGHIALNQLKRRSEPGRQWALAGLIIGYIWLGMVILSFLAYIVIAFILLIAGLAHGVADPGSYYNNHCVDCYGA